MTKEELAYLAGIIDGEGSIGVNKSQGGFRLNLEISNTNKLIIDWLSEKLEAAVYPYPCKNGRIKQGYKVYMINKAAQSVIQAVYPYLVGKVAQAEIALQFPIGETGYHYSEEDRLNRAISYIRLRKLNLKGMQSEDDSVK